MPAPRSLRRVPRAAAELVLGSGVLDDVPALAWHLLAAVVPLALGMTALASILLGDYERAQAFAEQAARALPAEVGDELVQLILRTRRDSPLLIVVSLVAMVWASSGAAGVVARVMSRQLGRERFGPLAGKARELALGGAVTVAVVLMALAASKASGLPERLGLRGSAAGWIVPVTAVLGTIAICAALYRHAPRGRLPWRAAASGAVPAGVLLQAIPALLGVYLQLAAGRTPVHVFLVLAGVLFTCWVAALALLLGATMAVARAGGATQGSSSPSWTARATASERDEASSLR